MSEQKMSEQKKSGTLNGKNICKSYGKKEVLKNLDVTIEAGCIYGLIGRNGVGKTTLLGILTGQNSMNSGEVSYDGMAVWDNKKALSHICFSREFAVPASSNGMVGMKIKQYLKMASYYYPNWDHQYAEALVEKFKLDKKQPIQKLSKGQMSMVTILVALASKADITILDEPVAGLDVIAREEFYRLLLEDYSETNRTFVVSTHIIEEASSVFERVLILDEGRIIVDNDTESFVNEFRFASGNEQELEGVLKQVSGVQVLSTQSLGKHKMVALRGNDKSFQTLEEKGIELENMTLQNAFVALCGHGDGGVYA